MADPNQLRRLLQGPDVWAAWREENPSVRPRLNRAPLRGVTLFGVDLSGADLRDADLRKADLFGVDLSGANLSGADARGAKLDMTLGLSQEQVDSLIGDEATQLPGSVKRPLQWAGKVATEVRRPA